MKEFDVVVIGSGPGGYVCAIRAAQLGFKVAIIEKYNTLGGTCLNVGCIPSKAYLDSSEKYYELMHSFADHGISAPVVDIDFEKMKSRVGKVVSDVCGGVKFLMKKNKIEVFTGTAAFKSPHEITVGSEVLKAQKIVIATGSKPSQLPGVVLDKKRIITSTEALKLPEIPKHLVVIGGGVIGLELSSVYRRLGSKVTVIEYADNIIPTMDLDQSKTLQKIMAKEGVNFLLGHGVKSAEQTSDANSLVKVVAENKNNKENVELLADYVLVAVGRRAFTEGLNLAACQIALDERGRIKVNQHLQLPNHPHIFAIGDVIPGPMLAHKAEEEGVFVAEFMAGQKPHINYSLIPGVVYTWPEVASVGATEVELKAKNIAYNVGTFPFKASGRARASNESEGFVKVLVQKESDEILGVHLIGPRAADMIGEAVVAMEYRASAEDIARTCHAHPTYSEALKEAALDATGKRAINM